MDKLGCSCVHRDMAALGWISYIAFWCTEICVYISQSHKYLYLHPLWTSQVTASLEGSVSPHVRGVLVLTHPRDDSEVPASSVLFVFRCSEVLRLSCMASDHLQGWSLP